MAITKSKPVDKDIIERDKKLAFAAGKGDREAFEMLFKHYHSRTYSLCMRILGNPMDAEDITQEVYIQLHKKIKTYRGDSSFTTWLHRITFNQALMLIRKRKTIKEDIAVTDEGLELSSAHVQHRIENPRKTTIIDNIALENAIEQLPQGYKSVLILHDIKGYEHEEVARILGISIGTSKSQLHKARLALRKLLSKVANPKLLPASEGTWITAF